MQQVCCKDCKYFQATWYENGTGGHCKRFPKWELVKEDHYCGEFVTEENIPIDDRITQLMNLIENPPKHDFWSAGEEDCPSDIKASNGEIHTLRCKKCGSENNPESPCVVDIIAGLKDLKLLL